MYEDFKEFIKQLNLIREYNIKNNSKCFLHPNIIDLNSNKEILETDFQHLNNENHNSNLFAKCLSPWTSVHVNVDGNLFPCMAVSMGNVKNTPLKTTGSAIKPCREFITEIVVNNKQKQMRGTACLTPKGEWEMKEVY